MIAYRTSLENGKVNIENSLGGGKITDSFPNALDFLLESHPYDFKVAWDLNAMISPLLAKLPPADLKKLWTNKELKFGSYLLNYYEKDSRIKTFIVRNSAWQANLYDLCQYFPDEPEPQDLKEVQRKGEQILAELEGCGIQPKKLGSPIGIIEQKLNELNLPTWENVPMEVNELAFECRSREWVTAFKLGYFPKTFDMDISGAYASAMENLLDIRQGYWTRGKEAPPGALYGVCWGRVTIDREISPIAYTDAIRHTWNPIGSWWTPLTILEINLIRDYSLGKWEPARGFWWTPRRDAKKPLNEFINKLFGYRQKSPLCNRIFKIALAAIYGQFLQTNTDFDWRTNSFKMSYGKRFMPLWGSHAETEIRMRLARWIYDHKLEDSLLAMTVDGYLSTQSVDIPQEKQLGSWKLDNIGDALIAGSSLLFYSSRKPHQILLPEALSLIKGNPDASIYPVLKTRRVTIGDLTADMTREMQELIFSCIGQKTAIKESLNIPLDHDRIFKPLPTTGGELLSGVYGSKPPRAEKLQKSNRLARWTESF